jgi:ribosome-associated toxin RatA of RatAB toxin-antitoxin module
MLQTRNSIRIQAPARLIYELAADVARWPIILAHYRFVDVLGGEKTQSHEWRRLRMGASQRHIPVTWTAIQRLFPDRKRIEYHHIKGATRGMDVVWQLVEAGDTVDVTIEHKLKSPLWFLRSPLTSHLVGKLFIMNIADKTLCGIKMEAERLANGFVT